MRSDSGLCVQASDSTYGIVNVGGAKATNIGYNCSGVGYSPNTSIYGEDDVTINSPQTYITGKTNISGATTIKNDFTVTDAQNVNIDSDSVNVSGYNYVSLYSFDGMDIEAKGGDIDIKAFYKLKIDSENIRAYITSNASNLKINDNTGHNALVRLAINGNDQALLVSENTLLGDGNYHNVFTLRTNRKDDNKQCINIQTFDTENGGCTCIGGGEIDLFLSVLEFCNQSSLIKAALINNVPVHCPDQSSLIKATLIKSHLVHCPDQSCPDQKPPGPLS